MKFRTGVVAVAISLIATATAEAQVHFATCATATGSNATVLIDPAIAPTINGLPLAAGDEIAVFTSSGLCAGSAEWTGAVIAITVWADDPFTSIVDGMTSGQNMVFVVWDASASVELGTGNGVVSTTFDSTVPYRGNATFAADAIYRLLSLVAVPDNEPPSASFSLTTSSGPAPLDVAFDGSISTDADGSITSYAWDFGDGSNATGSSASHTYANVGTYVVQLTVTDDDGEEDVATRSVSVTSPLNTPPAAAFTATPQVGPAPLAVAYDASLSTDEDGTITGFAWVFGDGATASGQSGSHVYTTPGTYTMKLTVTDEDGAGASVTREIQVTQAANVAPNATFSLSPTSGNVPLVVEVDASGSSDADGSIVSYAWNFGDGETATGVSTSHTYDGVGSFTVRLTITDDDGGTAVATRSVSVTSPTNVAPTAAFTVNATNGVAPFEVTFDASTSDDSDGTIASYEWRFGDGTSATGETATHTYTAAGTFEAQLTVTDNQGAQATSSRSITVALPTAEGGLVLHFPFEEGTGVETADLSGRGHNGELRDGAAWDPDGVFGGALMLDGQGGFVHVDAHDDLNLLLVPKRTISLWFRVDNRFEAARKQVIFEEGGPTRGLNIYVYDGLLYVGGWNSPVNESGWAGSFMTSNAVRSGVWHHVALVLNGNESIAPQAIRAYLDGVSIGSREGSQIWPHLDDIGVGGVNYLTLFHDGEPALNTNNSFAGLVDDVRLYNEALTGAQVAALFEESGELQNQSPVARMVVSPPGGQAPATLTFDATTSSDPENNIQVYRWTFGDGGSATGPVVTHTYDNAGSYTARLTVEDSEGLSSTASQTVVVSPASATNVAPVARFSVLELSDTGVFVRRLDASESSDSDGTIERYIWDFGDGKSDTGSVAIHTFPGSGAYVVKLTVVDDAGATASQQSTVEIRQQFPHELQVVSIGNVVTGGTVLFAEEGEVWSIDAPGGATDDPRVDAFEYVYRSSSGDDEMTVRVDSLENTDRWAFAGLMYRSALSTAAPHVAMTTTPETGPVFAYRLVDGGWEVKSQGTMVPPPIWLRIVRSGDRFEGQYSVDGTVWNTVGRQTVAMGVTVHAGMVASSNTADQHASVVLAGLRFGPDIAEPVLPSEHALSEVYPNPFRGTAELSLSLSKEEHVYAAVYNVLGQRVAVLQDDVMVAETVHTLSIDGKNLASGLYLVQVYGDSFRETRTVTLVR